MANVIFKRPVRLGKVIYPKSKRSQEVKDEKLLDGKLMKALIKSGDVSVVSAASAPAPAAKAAK